MSEPPVEPVPRKRVPVWLALTVVTVGGIAAQVAGGIGVALVIVLESIANRQFPPTLEHAEAVIASTLGFSVGAMGTSGVLLLAAVGTPLLARVRLEDGLGLRSAPWPAFPLAALGALALGPVGDLLAQALEAIAPSLSIGNLELISKVVSEGNLLVIGLFIIVVAPCAEELFFRGLLQGSIARPWLAVLVSGVVFACFHIDPPHVLGVLPIGLYFGWVRMRTGSTWVTIGAHVANNATATLLTRFAPDAAGEDSPLWLIAAGVVIASACTLGLVLLTRAKKGA